MTGNDVAYKKQLLEDMGLNSRYYEDLEPIAGRDELLNFLKENQNNPEIYQAGNDFINVVDKKFQANLHIHTTNSDGLMRVEDLLDLSAKYADEMVKKYPGRKFYLAITDHNTVNGTIEALKLVLKNKKKYKNLRIALGVEASAIFSSKQGDATSEVHLLSYGVNPFRDTIALINNKRLKIFQYNIKNALNSANVAYIDTINKYGIEFNFEDMAKIRPSIKTCPSNVRYSMKDYLQFRLLFAELVEKNPQVSALLRLNGVSAEDLDFSQPKNMICQAKEKPYWRNYVTQTRIYLENKIKEKNKYANVGKLQEVFGHVSDDLCKVLDSLEHTPLDEHSPLYIREPAALSFEEVTDSFKQAKFAVSGIAHGALYEQKNMKRGLFLQDLYRSFAQKLGHNPIIGEKHYPYPEDLDTKVADGMIKLYRYIPSGGLDSHKNNIFTPQTSYDKKFLNELIGSKDVLRDIEYSRV